MTKDPAFSDEAVYVMCSYLDRDRVCKRCPRTFDDPQYGLCWNGCYGLAEETLAVAREAMQRTSDQRPMLTVRTHKGDDVIVDVKELIAYIGQVRIEGKQPEPSCTRCVEHEQFRHQHRDCDRMGVLLQEVRDESVEDYRLPSYVVVQMTTSTWEKLKAYRGGAT